MVHDQSLPEFVSSLFGNIRHEIKTNAQTTACLCTACALLVVTYLILRFLLAAFQDLPTAAVQVYREWVVSILIGLAFTLIFTFWNYLIFRSELVPGSEPWKQLLRGHLKDIIVLLIMAAVFVSGLFHWTDQIAASPHRVMILGWILGPSLLVAFALSFLDLQFVAALEKVQVAKDIQQWQRDLLINHIYLRDLGLYIPLLAIMFFHTIHRVILAARA